MNRKYIFIALISGFILASCQSLIDENSSVIFEKSRTYKSREDALSALFGAYSVLQSGELYGKKTSRSLSDNASDQYRTSSGANMWSAYTWGPSAGELLTWWVGNYKLIGTANDFISNVDKLSDELILPTEKRALKAEMKFIRAIGYYNLVIAFGKVPMELDMPTDLSEVRYPTRAPLSEIYALIISDLREAEKYLPLTAIPNLQDGRATRGAAAALLAKVYLTKSETEAGNYTDFQAAADLCDDLITGQYGAYGLCLNYADVFNPEKEGGIEHIFSIKYDVAPNISSNVVLAFSPNLLWSSQTGGVPFVPHTLVSSFDQLNDKRFKYGIINKNPTTGVYLNTDKRFNFAKFQDEKKTKAGDDHCDVLFLRFADVLLLHSEALHRGNINLSKSGKDKYYGINKVRERAIEATVTGTCKILPITSGNYGTQDFLSILVQERAWEFYGEGKRRWDLLRTGKLEEVMNNYFITEAGQGFPTGVHKIEPKHLLFPIPLQEVETNKNLIPAGETNNGYVSAGGDDGGFE
jgi:hypothetical protein